MVLRAMRPHIEPATKRAPRRRFFASVGHSFAGGRSGRRDGPGISLFHAVASEYMTGHPYSD